MSLPISYLENVLHNASMPTIGDNYIIQIGDEFVTIKELIDFWVKGHKKILETAKIINDANKLIKENKEKECNTTGKNTSTQSQTTGKKSRKSTKKTTNIQK